MGGASLPGQVTTAVDAAVIGSSAYSQRLQSPHPTKIAISLQGAHSALVVEDYLQDGIFLADPRETVCTKLSADDRAVEVQNGSSGGPMMAGDGCRQSLRGRQALSSSSHTTTQPGEVHDPSPRTSEEYLDQAVETAVERAIFGGNELARRHFLQLIGASAATAIIRSAFPLETAKALAQEQVKDIEKKDLTVSFIPITCATPIIMAEPMGFNTRHGLNVTVRRAAGWAVVRDWAINKEVDATHMLSPMPLSITLGVGSPAVPYLMPAVENINGQAITLHIKPPFRSTPTKLINFWGLIDSPLERRMPCHTPIGVKSSTMWALSQGCSMNSALVRSLTVRPDTIQTRGS